MRVTSLYIYPVKSCRGISVERAPVVDRGFERDRRWMIVDDTGTFITQRDLPAMCRIETEVRGDTIALRAPGAGSIEIPLALDGGARRPILVWKHRGRAIAHPEASAWLSAVLGRSCHAVYMPDDERRPTSPTQVRSTDIVSFADGYPFLLISRSSLADLGERSGVELSERRFRPNIVIDGDLPYAEDDWTELRIGDVGFHVTKRCYRCVVTTVDPDTGTVGREPLATLARYRRWDDHVWFGVNLMHGGRGVIRVGDSVTIG